MPRFVDHEQRKAEIVAAVVEAIAEGGFKSFTLRSLAQRMGGSSTLITHYFPNREALLQALLDSAMSEATEQAETLQRIADPHERLHAVLEWFLPNTPESLQLERVRIVLVGHIESEPMVAGFFKQLEEGMRGLMRKSLQEFVDPKALEDMVDLLRAWTSGVALSAVEHPEIWSPQRQLAALDRFLSSLSLPMRARPRGRRTRAR